VQKIIALLDLSLVYDGYVRRLVVALFRLLYGYLRVANGVVTKAIPDGKYMANGEHYSNR
jgi:hypothetical protein